MPPFYQPSCCPFCIAQYIASNVNPSTAWNVGRRRAVRTLSEVSGPQALHHDINAHALCYILITFQYPLPLQPATESTIMNEPEESSSETGGHGVL